MIVVVGTIVKITETPGFFRLSGPVGFIVAPRADPAGRPFGIIGLIAVDGYISFLHHRGLHIPWCGASQRLTGGVSGRFGEYPGGRPAGSTVPGSGRSISSGPEKGIVVSIIPRLISPVIAVTPIIVVDIIVIGIPTGGTPGIIGPIKIVVPVKQEWIGRPIAIGPGIPVPETVVSLPPVPAVKVVERIKSDANPWGDESKTSGIIIRIIIPGIPIERVVESASDQWAVKAADPVGITVVVLVQIIIGFIIVSVIILFVIFILFTIAFVAIIVVLVAHGFGPAPGGPGTVIDVIVLGRYRNRTGDQREDHYLEKTFFHFGFLFYCLSNLEYAYYFNI